MYNLKTFFLRNFSAVLHDLLPHFSLGMFFWKDSKPLLSKHVFFNNKCQNQVFDDTTFMLQDWRWPDDNYMNNNYINVINSTKKRYRVENSEQTENT